MLICVGYDAAPQLYDDRNAPKSCLNMNFFGGQIYCILLHTLVAMATPPNKPLPLINMQKTVTNSTYHLLLDNSLNSVQTPWILQNLP